MISTLPAPKLPPIVNISGPRRGDTMPTGGRFVGRAATTWVSYGNDADFNQMCQDFDRIWGSAQRLLKPCA